jgi:site-specific DNA recombinase
MTAKAPKRVRCAVYTRVSTEYGLDQEFNSLDAQHEAAEAYIRSQAHDGWTLLRSRYDDGGYSGGSTDRPALQRLLEDIRTGKIDIIVVYKVDRLTRSLADFAKLVELFDAHAVSFVSVTQQFNTTSSMGRLTLNVLLSFAQFEREVTGERIRDKIAASKRKGIWVGGNVPLGYESRDKKLVVHEDDVERVRTIFRRYLEVGSIGALLSDLRDRGIVSKRRTRPDGSAVGGIPFTRGALAYLLHNRCYIGEVVHRGQVYPGEHQAILDRDLFEAVQRRLGEQRATLATERADSEAMLLGRIFDDRGNRMTPSHCRKTGTKYRYYTSSALTQGQPELAGSISRVPALEIEAGEDSMNKVTVTAIALAAGFGAGAAWSQAPQQGPRFQPTPYFQMPLENDPSRVVRLQSVVIPAGAGNQFHRHPGDQWWAVQEGEVTYTIKGQPPRVLKAGEFVYVPRGTVHRNQNLSSMPARSIELNITDKDKPQTEQATE